MRNKILSFLLAVVFASPAAPAPKCYVKGLIENVRFEKAYERPCVKTNSCPTDVATSYPDTYYLSVEIQSASLKEGDTSFRSCDSLYQAKSSQKIFITKDKVKSGDTFSKGQIITGTTVSSWGNSFESYDIIGGKPLSIFEKVKVFLNELLFSLRNFLRGRSQPATVPKTYEECVNLGGKVYKDTCGINFLRGDAEKEKLVDQCLASGGLAFSDSDFTGGCSLRFMK